jgi:hypothetical protein
MADLERAENPSQKRRDALGAPVYVLTEFSRHLERDHPALHEQIMNAAGDPAELQKLFQANEESLEAISAMRSRMRQ